MVWASPDGSAIWTCTGKMWPIITTPVCSQQRVCPVSAPFVACSQICGARKSGLVGTTSSVVLLVGNYSPLLYCVHRPAVLTLPFNNTIWSCSSFASSSNVCCAVYAPVHRQFPS